MHTRLQVSWFMHTYMCAYYLHASLYSHLPSLTLLHDDYAIVPACNLNFSRTVMVRPQADRVPLRASRRAPARELCSSVSRCGLRDIVIGACPALLRLSANSNIDSLQRPQFYPRYSLLPMVPRCCAYPVCTTPRFHLLGQHKSGRSSLYRHRLTDMG